tara:strand:+ start:152 stop:553 length:402 start_codon:yes stop_codon:yes gene_type:complete
MRSPGVENWIIRSLLGTVRKKGWDIGAVQENASSELRNFLRQEKVRNVLASLNLTPQEINQKNCLRAVGNAVVGKEDPQKKRAAARLAKVKAGAGAGQKSDGQREGSIGSYRIPFPSRMGKREMRVKSSRVRD